MTSSKHLRRRLAAAAVMLLVATAFMALAPTRIGGSTDYVSTYGSSMEPGFHTGDLAIVRRAGQYRVGDVAAYRSPELNRVVMHRIIARKGGRYVFQGDNNDFVDPSPVARSDLVGRLWLRVPHAGRVLDLVHTPAMTALLTAAAAALLLFVGDGRRRRGRDRRRGDCTPTPRGARPMASPPPRIHARQILVVSAVAGVAFLALAVFAFTRPASRAVTVKTPYSEQVTFGYGAQAPEGPVYRGGVVRTGDPVFLRLVRRVRVTAGYAIATQAPHHVSGTVAVVARISSPTGWTRDVTLSPPTRFTGDRARSAATLDLPRLRSLVDRLERLTGAAPGGGYTIAVVARVKLRGTLSGVPLTSTFAPELSFQVDALQMKPGGGSATAGAKADDIEPSRKRTLAVPSSAPSELSVRGHGLPVATARRIALAGLLLAAAGALLSRLPRLRRPADPAAQIQARYEHLIIPIAGMSPNPGQAAIDVTSIDALAQLATRNERLILHHHHPDADTYLVDDAGALYRYQTRRSGPRQAPAAHAVGDTSSRQAGNGQT